MQVSQVFWPAHCNEARPGYLIGWNIRHFSCSIIAVVSADHAVGTLGELEQRLANLASDAQVGNAVARCTESGAAPVVLGEWLGGDCDAAGGSARMPQVWLEQARDKQQAANIWLTMGMRREDATGAGRLHPTLESIHCCGRLRRTASHIITYQPVDKDAMHFLTTRPYNALRAAQRPRRRTDMDFVVHQINVCEELQRALQRVLGVREGSSAAAPLPIPAALPVADADGTLSGPEAALLHLCARIPCAAVRYAAGVFVWVAARPLWSLLPMVGGHPLKEVSLLVQVLDLRVREVLRWPLIYQRLRQQMRADSTIFPTLSVEYMALLSSVCCAGLDLLAGWALCAFLVLKGSWVLVLWHRIGDALHIDMLRGQIKWLMGAPAGFKLNEPLNEQLGSILLRALGAWDSFTTVLTPLEPALVACMGCCGILGCTMLLALASDILSVVTAHVQLVFYTFSNVHKFQVRCRLHLVTFSAPRCSLTFSLCSR